MTENGFLVENIPIAWTLGDELGTFIFGLGTLILGSDYTIIKYLSKRVYNWIEHDRIEQIIEQNYRAQQYYSQFVEDKDVEKLDLEIIGNGNFRAGFPDHLELVEEGMKFELCVWDVTEPSGEPLRYPLKLGRMTLNKLEDSEGGPVGFLSVDEWYPPSDSPDPQRRDDVRDCQQKLKNEGSDNCEDIEPFAQVSFIGGDFEQTNINDWETVYHFYHEVEPPL
ncbi:hypothetical protein RBH20_09780 [Haloarcula sp. H-GB4]|uniref:hypothetical protein n=1 Tax=Haloarcula sp. H-GB4 TaxID=3069755 RepID=UPI0027B755ED|nr:hypothetical protein [Haloarcula sp. H-GB4]MDQ2072823.1 hypothetical protein [Haloarcula sp. H-GB4]